MLNNCLKPLEFLLITETHLILFSDTIVCWAADHTLSKQARL